MTARIFTGSKYRELNLVALKFFHAGLGFIFVSEYVYIVFTGNTGYKGQ